MGRVCSALPGSTADGMGAPRARHYGPATGNGAPDVPEELTEAIPPAYTQWIGRAFLTARQEVFA
jgi:hypothetical protein